MEAKPYLYKFIEEFDPELKKRVRFQPFLLNPYDNQQRVVNMCNVILDSNVYNGHTTAVDALWGGVPVISMDGGRDMGARVGLSILTALNMTELIVKVGEALLQHYRVNS